jgi:hypothetical protein
MAKKSRRARRKGASPRLSKAQLTQPMDQEASRAVEAPAVESAKVPVQQPDVRAPFGPSLRTKPQTLAAGRPRSGLVEPSNEATDFREEYRYVVRDLQRIGILAAAMLGGLVILSFIL